MQEHVPDTAPGWAEDLDWIEDDELVDSHLADVEGPETDASVEPERAAD